MNEIVISSRSQTKLNHSDRATFTMEFSCLTFTVIEEEWIQPLHEEASQGGPEDFGNSAVRIPVRMIGFLDCDDSQKNGQPLLAAIVVAFFE
jgi:hypothetical protein